MLSLIGISAIGPFHGKTVLMGIKGSSFVSKSWPVTDEGESPSIPLPEFVAASDPITPIPGGPSPEFPPPLPTNVNGSKVEFSSTPFDFSF